MSHQSTGIGNTNQGRYANTNQKKSHRYFKEMLGDVDDAVRECSDHEQKGLARAVVISLDSVLTVGASNSTLGGH